jgi:hypothetical protein
MGRLMQVASLDFGSESGLVLLASRTTSAETVWKARRTCIEDGMEASFHGFADLMR